MLIHNSMRTQRLPTALAVLNPVLLAIFEHLAQHRGGTALFFLTMQLREAYTSNPRQRTAQPTTERLLRALGEIPLTIVRLSQHTVCHVTPLSTRQYDSLVLLGFPTSTYKRLTCYPAQIPPRIL